MSVASTTRKQNFTTDGATSTFSFTFPCLVNNPADIKCAVKTGSTTYNLTYITDYTVTPDSDGVGGYVFLVSAAAVSKGTMTVYRDTTNLQSSDYEDFNQFPANTLERDLDTRTMVAQEMNETIQRSLLLPITSTVTGLALPEPEADKGLYWNAGATALENRTAASMGTITLATEAIAAAGTNDTAYMSAAKTSYALAAGTLRGNMTTLSVATISTPGALVGALQATTATIGTVSVPAASVGNLNATTVTVGTLQVNTALAGAGLVVGYAYTYTGVRSAGTTVIPFDNSVPQNTEGDQYFSLSLTPKKSTNLVKIDVVMNVNHTNAGTICAAAVFQDAGADAIAVVWDYMDSAGGLRQLVLSHTLVIGTAGTTTFTVRAGGQGAGTFTMNGGSGTDYYSGTLRSGISLTEIGV